MSVRVGGQVVELTAPHTMKITEYPRPAPEPGEIVVAVAALGLCGTDLHLYVGRGGSYPWVTGHDGAGLVSAVGAAVSGFEVGQRVAVDPVLHCGKCAACASGRVQLCRFGGYLGMLGPGMAAQFVALPARQVFPLPDKVSDLAATALEPIAVALHTLRRVAPLLPEPGPAVVIGGGPLGLLQTQVMAHFGWSCVVVEPRPKRRAKGAELGLTMLDPAEAMDVDAGLIVETSAAADGVDLADRLAGAGTVVAVVGRGPHSIPPPSVLLKELSMLGIKGGPGQYAATIELVATGIVDPTAVITHTYRWSDAPKAFADTAADPETILRSALVGPW